LSPAVAGHGLVLQPTLNVYAVYAHRQYLSNKVRASVDFLAKYFGPEPCWERSLD
jgi:hypothetical protein